MLDVQYTCTSLLFSFLNSNFLKGAYFHGGKVVLFDPGLDRCNFLFRKVLDSLEVDLIEDDKDRFIFEEGLNGMVEVDLF